MRAPGRTGHPSSSPSQTRPRTSSAHRSSTQADCQAWVHVKICGTVIEGKGRTRSAENAERSPEAEEAGGQDFEAIKQAVRGQVLATAARTVECRLKRGPRRLPGSDRAVRLRIVGYRASSSRQDQVPRKLRATSKNPLAPGPKMIRSKRSATACRSVGRPAGRDARGGTGSARLPGGTMASMQDMQSLVVGYADLLAMPADGRRYEIHGGELVVVPSRCRGTSSPSRRCSCCCTNMRARPEGLPWPPRSTSSSTSTTSCSRTYCLFRAERRHLVRPDAVTRHAPDVAVEVLSPSTAAADRGRKMRTFARYGVPRMLDRRPGARTDRNPRARCRRLPAGAGRVAR